MKKALLLVLALTLIVAMAACGGKDNSETPDNSTPPGESQGGTTASPSGSESAQDIDLGAIFSGNGGDTLISSYSEAAKQAFIEDAQKDGYDVEFKADGSMVMTDAATGDTITQNADGTWTIEESGGGQVQVSGDWSDNEFTKLLPAPDFALVGASTSAGQFAVGFSGVTVEQVKDYTEKVKEKGFTVGAETQDENLMGMIVFIYSAQNAEGYSVRIAFSSGTAGLTISQP